MEASKESIERVRMGGQDLLAFNQLEPLITVAVAAVAEAKSIESGPEKHKKLTEAKAAKDSASRKISRVAKDLGTSRNMVIAAAKDQIYRNFNDRIHNMLLAAQTCDLCFVVDCTGSMSDVLEGIKTQIEAVVKGLSASLKHLKLRLAFVGYRDQNDADHFVVSDFDPSIPKFLRIVSETKAEGGDDICEDVIGGLDKALKLDWQYSNRVLVLCGDAPCHGTMYHNLGSSGDSHPEGLGIPSKPILQSLREKTRCQINFLRLNSSTDLMIRKFNEEIGGEYITTDRLDRSAPDFGKSIGASVRTSIDKSITRSMGAVSKGKVGLDPGPKIHILSSLQEEAGEEPVPPTREVPF